MKSHIFLTIALAVAATITISCGGVANNPTSPNFNQGGVPGQPGQGGTGQPGAQDQQTGPPSLEDLQGVLGGEAEQPEEQIIQGTFDTLWPQGLTSMEQGQIVQAAQYFKSALSASPDSADAALAYAITDIMRDHRRYAVFMHPGIDKLFMNTPLVGVSEVFPNPFLSEDSYFLRLAALGNNMRTIFHAEPFQVIAPVDTEMVFTPEFLAQFDQEGMMVTSPRDMPVPEGGVVGVEETPGPAAGNPEEETPAEGGDTTSGDSDTPDEGGQMGAGPVRMGIDMQNHGKQGEQDLGAPPRGAPDKDDPTFGGGGMMEAGGFEQPFTPPAVIQERELPINEDEWENYIMEYRNSARRDGADIFLSGPFYNNINTLHDELSEHIRNLESVRSAVEVEGYNLILPFNAIDGTQKVSMVFDYNDYKLILGYFKLLDILLTYVTTYNHVVTFELPTDAISDTDEDAIISPDEYLPGMPFGTITDEDKQTLAALLPELLNVLNQLNADMQPLIDEAKNVQAGDPETKELFYMSSFNRNFALIEEWNDLLIDIGHGSSSGVTLKLESGGNIADTVVVYDVLFNNPVMNIRDVLPSFEASTGAVITDDEGVWSGDPTWGGFYPETIQDDGIFTRSGRMSLEIFDENMSKASNLDVSVGQASGHSNESGAVQLNNVTVNELMGTTFTVSDSAGTEVGSGSIRTLSEIILLFDIDKLNFLFGQAPEIGEPTVVTTEEGEIVELDAEGTSTEDGIFSTDEVTGDESGDENANGDEGDGDEGDEGDGEGDDGDGDGGGDGGAGDTPGTTGSLG